MKIFLIGLSGVGKTSIGKQLSTRLNVNFIDSDQFIEEKEGTTIKSIFDANGEGYFRSLETSFIANFDTVTSEQSVVVSTGGGLPCFNDNMTKLLQAGIVVWLDLPIKVLVSRVKNSTVRPLLNENTEEVLTKQFAERERFYAKAHIKVEALNWNAKKMDDLVEQLNQINSI